MKRQLTCLALVLSVATVGAAARIFSGTTDNSREVVRVAGQCSGVFVAATMVLTAKHCFTSEEMETLIWSPEMGNTRAWVPAGGFFDHDDLAIVCAPNPHHDVASIADTSVNPEDQVVVKGYGWRNHDTRDPVRRRGTTSVGFVLNEKNPKADRFRIEGGPGAPCHGDSGGPVYNQSGRLVGISEQFNFQSQKCGDDAMATVTVPSRVRAVMKRVTAECAKSGG